ncbi:MAG: hypothetical protein IH600_18650 [Bacteroidetes bacterium]|nr:hypothetical protein [Bacteroidota bacterium]
MKSRIFVLIVIAAAFTLGGCIESQVLVSVKKDGSGTIRELVKMNRHALEPFKEMAEQMQASADESGAEVEQSTELMEPFKDEEIREQAAKLGAGVRYVSHERIDDDQFIGYTAVFEFDDITTVTVDQNPGASVPNLGGEEGEGTSDEGEKVMFSFTRGNPATLVIRTPSGTPGESADGTETGELEDGQPGSDADQEGGDELFEQMREFLRDMKIVVQVAVDGSITETNAAYVDGSTVTIMDIDFNRLIDDPEMLKQLQKTESMDPKAAKELLKSIPGLRVETEEAVTVKFK